MAGGRTGKMSQLVSKAAGDVSPSLPCSPERLETQGGAQMRDSHLFAFNLRLTFQALDNGKLAFQQVGPGWGGWRSGDCL